MNVATMSTSDLTALIERLENDLDCIDLEDGAAVYPPYRHRIWQQERDAVAAKLRDAQTEHDARWETAYRHS